MEGLIKIVAVHGFASPSGTNIKTNTVYATETEKGYRFKRKNSPGSKIVSKDAIMVVNKNLIRISHESFACHTWCLPEQKKEAIALVEKELLKDAETVYLAAKKLYEAMHQEIKIIEEIESVIE